MPEIFENPVDDLQLAATEPLLPGRISVRSLGLIGLFVLGCFYTLYFARDFFIPIVLAVVFSFLLGPLVRILHGLKIPLMLGAAIVIVG